MIGKTISHYKILEKLGEGGMGVVYKAEDTRLERIVALKFLAQQNLGGEEERARFIREAKAAAALNHPNICTVHEIDDTGDQAFIAMEYIEGKGLVQKIESGPLEITEALHIAIQIAEGLRRAHKRGIVHRDIKSANIMIDEDGQAKILDFGLAKLIGKTRLTKTATVMGTIAYMSPEQTRGDKDIGHQTDIWSLGVVLYEMLTGLLPFDAETDTGLIYKIINENPEAIENHRSDIPGSLVSIIEKSMQKDPQRRYKDAEDLITDLEAVKLTSTTVADKSSPSIAVLPFVNMSADSEQEYFCDGLAEELINALTQIKNLKVIARTSAFSFRGKEVDIRDIGKKLDVGNVLEGSVRKAGNRLRITAQLIDTESGHHLWSEKYDREMEDIFAIQDEISEAIVEKLKPRILGEEKPELRKRQTVNVEAYNLYLKGRWFWYRRSEGDLKKAIEYFKQAIETAPDYAPAYTGLADSYLLLPVYGPFRPRDVVPKGREAAITALNIDDTLAEAHASLGFAKSLYEWDWKQGEAEFRRAIDLNPGYATVHHWYALQLMIMGRFEEAVHEQRRALDLDPFSLVIIRQYGQIFYHSRKYDRAVETFIKAIEMDPRFVFAHLFLGLTYLGKGMYEDALEEFQKEKDILANWSQFPQTYIGATYAVMGENEKAREALKSLVNKSRETYVPPALIAYVCIALREDDRGFDWLEKAYEEGDSSLSYIKIEPIYDSVRSDPRYIALLKKMNLAP